METFRNYESGIKQLPDENELLLAQTRLLSEESEILLAQNKLLAVENTHLTNSIHCVLCCDA